MTDNREPHHTENVREHFQKVNALLEKYALVEPLAHRQETPRAKRH